MTQLETRYPCPVCLGSTLQKSVVVEAPQLMIDHCARCGGVWFDYGEVQALKRCEPKVLWELVAPHTEVHRMQCHRCQTHLTRNESLCPGCGHASYLDCPKCGRQLEVAYHQGLRLDACVDCKGVWFDRHELDAIWQLELNAALKRRTRLQEAGSTARDVPLVLLDSLTYDPWIAFYGVHVAAEALAAAPEIVGGVGGAVAEAASSVFETIVDIIGGIFG